MYNAEMFTQNLTLKSQPNNVLKSSSVLLCIEHNIYIALGAPAGVKHSARSSDLRAQMKQNKMDVRKFRGTGAIKCVDGMKKVQKKPPDLEGWLDKKKKRRRKGYDTRYVVLKGMLSAALFSVMPPQVKCHFPS